MDFWVSMPNELVLVVGLALLFEFLNGMRDASNIVATMIYSRAFQPRAALFITAVAEFIGPFLFGVVVARTIGDGIVDSNLLTLNSITACLLGAIVWNLFTWFFGLPSSSSHALIGGLIGAIIISAGVSSLKWSGLNTVVLGLILSPLFGFIVGFLLLRMIYFLVQKASPRINSFFKRGQIVTAVGLGLGHGTNHTQKIMGVIMLSLSIGGAVDDFSVPFWVIVSTAAALAIGTAIGGWRLIHTLGGKFYKVRPVHGFAAQLTSAIVIVFASLTGAPVSTTQVVSSAIVGVGSSERLGKVRWSVTRDIALAWIVTIPASAILSAAIYLLIKTFL
ncbi:MAG TPA: inorganic phosphate transporter [Anaerolineales bacterium]|nr:inorganic phosphate transporter [Anaerolineales bacterium]